MALTLPEMEELVRGLELQIGLLTGGETAAPEDPIMEGFGVDPSPDASPVYGAQAIPALFDLFDRDNAARTFKIRGAGNYETCVGGAFEAVAAGSGWTFSGNDYQSPAMAAGTGARYVWLDLDRTSGGGATATIKSGTTPTTPDDDTVVKMLWMVTVSSDVITAVMSLREQPIWTPS